jgi:hypothetical protein
MNGCTLAFVALTPAVATVVVILANPVFVPEPTCPAPPEAANPFGELGIKNGCVV